MIRSTLKAAAIAAATLSATLAHGALSPTSPGCTVSVLNPTYTSCGGSFSGNDKQAGTQSDVLAYITSTWGESFSFLGSSDTPTTFGPFTSNPNAVAGTLTFDTAIDSAFVLALKAGSTFSLFYYNGVGAPISSIDYTTAGVGVITNGPNAGNPLALSHASLYSVTAVPEPETYALMLAGLGLVGFMASRRRPS